MPVSISFDDNQRMDTAQAQSIVSGLTMCLHTILYYTIPSHPTPTVNTQSFVLMTVYKVEHQLRTLDYF